MKITVVDAPCGAGKTCWAIEKMRADKENRYIFVTPFLSEIDRIKAETKGERDFREPENRGDRKLDDFNRLIAMGADITTTHVTFANANEDTFALLRDNNYTLILDEAINVLVEYNSIFEGKNRAIKKDDIQLLMSKGFISVDDYNRVHWINPDVYESYAYADVERLAKRGNLLLLKNDTFMWEFPRELFENFNKIYILTYMFEGCYLKSYFDYQGLQYEKASIYTDQNTYCIGPYRSDAPQRKAIGELLHVSKELNHFANGQLSITGYRTLCRKTKDTPTSIKLKNSIYNYFHNKCKAKASDILWTAPKDYKNRLNGQGYTKFKKPGDSEYTECFLSLNARASNGYQDRHFLAYMVNLHSNPEFDKYFSKRMDADGNPIGLNKDLYAVGNLIQWVWRSAIRKGEPVWLYLPAPRMRKLLNDWLDGKI